MAKSTFYFVLFVMVAVDVVQSRYQKKLLAERAHREAQMKKMAANDPSV
jgi:cell division protein FtsL